MTTDMAKDQPMSVTQATIKSMTENERTELSEKGVTLPMGYQQLQHYLPHRFPFMLIDRVTSCRPNECITGYKNVTINEPFFQGHFPDQPIMPGVLIVEAMAQLSGILAFISEGVTVEDGYLSLFGGIDKVRFKKQVVPGDQLEIKSEMLVHKHKVFKFSCKAYVDNKIAASAQITIAGQKSPTDAVDQ